MEATDIKTMILLPEGNTADTVNSCKYLGISQADWNHEEATR